MGAQLCKCDGSGQTEDVLTKETDVVKQVVGTDFGDHARCPVCEKTFRPKTGTSIDALAQHVKKTDDPLHQILAERMARGKTLPCLVCAENFANAGDMLQHLSKQHAPEAVMMELLKLDEQRELSRAMGEDVSPASQRDSPASKAGQQRREAARAIYAAAQAGDTNGVSRLIDAWGARGGEASSSAQELLDTPLDDGYTALMASSQAGHASVVSLLLDRKANIHVKNAYGQAAIHFATVEGRSAVVGELIRREETCQELIHMEYQGDRPLLLAVQSQSLEAVRMLVTAKASTDVDWGTKKTPLSLAISQESEGICAVLAPHSSPFWTNAANESALYLAVVGEERPNKAIVQILAKQPGVDLKKRFHVRGKPGSKAETLFILARRAGHKELMPLLVPSSGACCVIS